MPLSRLDHLSVGVREIDAATESLRYLMGRLFEPLVECRRAEGTCDRTRCTRLAALMAFARRNFEWQERWMAENSYPHDDHHRRDHWRLLDQLARMHAADVCAERERGVVTEVVARWAFDHVDQCDRRLARWALTRRLAAPG